MAGRIWIEPYKPLDVRTPAVPDGGYIRVDASAASPGTFGPSPLMKQVQELAQGVPGLAQVLSEQLARDNEAAVKDADARLGESEQAVQVCCAVRSKEDRLAMDYTIEAVAKEMSEFAADIVDARVDVLPEGPDGMRIFSAWLSADVSRGTVISLCRGWARIIRKSLPERREDWAGGILVMSPLGRGLGAYCIGWVGHEDEWREDDGSNATDQQEWQGLYQRLYDYLRVHGTSDWQGRGDYFLFDEASGHPDQSITIYRIEFLTPDLVSGIQGILTDGYADWCVYIVLDLIPPIDDITSDGIEIYADRIVERWDRALLTERLGERLKV